MARQGFGKQGESTRRMDMGKALPMDVMLEKGGQISVGNADLPEQGRGMEWGVSWSPLKNRATQQPKRVKL